MIRGDQLVYKQEIEEMRTTKEDRKGLQANRDELRRTISRERSKGIEEIEVKVKEMMERQLNSGSRELSM
jgi:hypothetical protein